MRVGERAAVLFLMEFWATPGTGLLLGPQRGRSTGDVLEPKAVRGLELCARGRCTCPRSGHSLAHSGWTSPDPQA